MLIAVPRRLGTAAAALLVAALGAPASAAPASAASSGCVVRGDLPGLAWACALAQQRVRTFWPQWDGTVHISVGPAAGAVGVTGAQGVVAVTDAQGVVVDPTAWARLSDEGRQVVLTHEVVHVATWSATTSRTPTWLVEGLAEAIAERGSGLPVKVAAQELAADVRRGEVPEDLPVDATFSARPAQAYEESWLAVALLLRTYGDAAVVRLYRAVGAEAIGTALRGLGTSHDALVRAWRADLVRRLS